MNKIEWNITEQSLTQELVSSDNRWHITKNQEGDNPPEFFLSQYDLLLSPHGTGTDYRECFESFIKSCDDYMARVTAIQAEAKEHLQRLIETAKELPCED